MNDWTDNETLKLQHGNIEGYYASARLFLPYEEVVTKWYVLSYLCLYFSTHSRHARIDDILNHTL